MPFTRLGLRPELLKAVEALGYAAPTPIQEKSLPESMQGKDIIGSAMTGSGKTLAFVLPLLQKLLDDRDADPVKSGVRVRALVLVPTRELAAQVEKAVGELAKFSPVKCALIIGGASFTTQRDALKRGAEVVCATPGRLLDLLRSGDLHLRDVKVAVLDEADRMLDMGFMPDVRRIMQLLPKERQTLMFSATIPIEVERVVNEFMRSPVRVEVDRPRSTATTVKQWIYPVTEGQKGELLAAIVQSDGVDSVIVFTRTKARADYVAHCLNRKQIGCGVLHSDLTQAARDRAMQDFRDGKITILVATDLAARGLDVPEVSHVINYDVPEHADDYVHRIGRTGRAMTEGDAVTLVNFEEERMLPGIEAFIGQEIPRKALDGFQYLVPPRLHAYKQPLSSKFRIRRVIPRGGGSRFKR
ncbi:MAG: DEAD/DEAH box helicase [Elusimicrobia bacterium]|nr:DEAD/DEAH box helicase [Elusimicrobiota bacterium]MDE2512292.1 DEAD/DEAH box helicase [Elusimicrobiota bacterium]